MTPKKIPNPTHPSSPKMYKSESPAVVPITTLKRLAAYVSGDGAPL